MTMIYLHTNPLAAILLAVMAAFVVLVVALLIVMLLRQRRELWRIKRALARFIVESIRTRYPQFYASANKPIGMPPPEANDDTNEIDD